MAEPTGIALLSVYDKNGIEAFAKNLSEMGWLIYASGGTAKALMGANIEVKDTSELVGGEAILGHRVVTLSREISAGLLANKDSEEDINEMAELNIPIIDLVCVDMYPLEQTIQAGEDKSVVIEQTDIGGPTLLRSAAKGKRIVLSHPSQRGLVVEWLKSGKPDETKFVEKLAARAEYEVARYVITSAKNLNGGEVSGYLATKNFPTKYGENPQQANAAFYADNRIGQDALGLDQFEHVKGMEKSYVNMTDVDRLLQTITHIAAGFYKNFNSVPKIAVGVKHGNACGAAVSDDLSDAVEKMLLGDTRAIFGGVIMLNGEINEKIANTLMFYAHEGDKPRLLDGVIGSSVSDEALEILSRNKLRVVVNPKLESLSLDSLDSSRRARLVRGGVLEQPNYDYILDYTADYVQRHGEPSEQQLRDMVLAWAIGCTSNSNTIAIVKNSQLIGNGVGQQDRVGAAQLAITRTTNEFPTLSEDGDKLMLSVTLDKSKLEGSVAYSDSFFPFPDGPELLAKAGVKAILSSSGSVGDKSVIEMLESYKVSVVLVPDKVARGFYMH
jgi:phosphoribosylaminoimidazolecarboxamide formyltransferase/IMP cyclohydrolase